MKSPGDIAQKLKQSQFRHSKKEIERLLSRSPGNCVFQRKVEVPGFGLLGFCTCSEIGLKACDSFAPHLNRAPDCPKFKLRLTEEEARESVKSFFKNSSPEEIIARYPGVAALMWVLDDEQILYQDPYLVPGFDFPLWAASPEDAAKASDILSRRAESSENLSRENATVTTENDDLKKQILSLDKEVGTLRESNKELSSRVSVLQTCLCVYQKEPKVNPNKTSLVKSILVSVSIFISSLFKKNL